MGKRDRRPATTPGSADTAVSYSRTRSRWCGTVADSHRQRLEFRRFRNAFTSALPSSSGTGARPAGHKRAQGFGRFVAETHARETTYIASRYRAKPFALAPYRLNESEVKGSTLLFEPLPIARLGVRRDDDAVVVGTDFSSFGYLLEEFVSLGVLKIAIPKSFPETSALNSAPKILRQRISIIDDDSEIESIRRILNPLMRELEIGLDEKTGELKKPRGLSRQVFLALQKTRRDLECMALGHNHSIHIDLDPDTARTSARMLREVARGPTSRAILASFEGILSCYEKIEFKAVTPPVDVPSTMVSLFDDLVNNPQYVEYSEAVAKLGIIRHRSHALSRIRALGHAIAASNRIVSSWDYVAKVINAWSGMPIPQSATLSNLFSIKSLPTTVNLQPARERALKMWMASSNHNVPYNRFGYPLQRTNVNWLPPLNSASAPQSGATYQSLGTVGELLGRLRDFENARGRCD